MSAKTNSDATILKQVKQGNIDAFGQLVNKYTPSVYKLCKSKLSAKEDAEDLTQNSFISLYKSIDRLDPARPLLPYLYMIARNELKMFYRKYKPTISLDDQISATIASPPTPEEQNAALLLRDLSPGERRALEMIYEGFTYQEIASALHKPINTVRTIIRRARLQINKIRNV